MSSPQRFLLFAITLIALCGARSHSTSQDTDAGRLGACEETCPTSPGRCHWQIAQYLFHGGEATLPPCFDSRQTSVSDLKPTARVLLGIQQLNLALANPSGITRSLLAVHMEKAAAYVNLAHLYFEAHDSQAASAALGSAAREYRSILSDLTNEPSQELIDRLASGLIRAGAPLDAIMALERLPVSDSSRSYLAAEALFSLGDRSGAALYYETWIAGGCQSDIYMVTYNEYGRLWTLLPLKRPSTQTRCEQLPAELRVRLETLREQFRHPDNIPRNSYPSVPFPDHADSTTGLE